MPRHPDELTPDGERERLGRRERLNNRGEPEDAPPCPSCGGPNTPGGPDVCPACEDLAAAGLTHDTPPGDPRGAGRVPPHGNTTR